MKDYDIALGGVASNVSYLDVSNMEFHSVKGTTLILNICRTPDGLVY